MGTYKTGIGSSSMEYIYDEVCFHYGDSITMKDTDDACISVHALLYIKDLHNLNKFGSPPNDNALAKVCKGTWSKKTIRGHLLNQYLGGGGGFYNLFPFTNSANKNHSDHFEGTVKNFIHNKYNDYLKSEEESDGSEDSVDMDIDYDEYCIDFYVDVIVINNDADLHVDGPKVICYASDSYGLDISNLEFNAFQ